jgi:hypothetical protein
MLLSARKTAFFISIGIGLIGASCSNRVHETLLQTQKDREVLPEKVTYLSFYEFMRWPLMDLRSDGRTRENWPASDLDYVKTEECQAFRVEGYLIEWAPEKKENDGDYHVWIGGQRTNDKSDCFIAEITPYFLKRHPSWRIGTLNSLARDNARVRVTGWLMWDEDHPEEVGKTRATQWEIHPVTNFEIYSEGSWITLDEN